MNRGQKSIIGEGVARVLTGLAGEEPEGEGATRRRLLLLNRVRNAAKIASGMGVMGAKWGAGFFTGEVITGLL